SAPRGMDLFKPSYSNGLPCCDLLVNTMAYLIIRSEIDADKARRSHARTDSTIAAYPSSAWRLGNVFARTPSPRAEPVRKRARSRQLDDAASCYVCWAWSKTR